MIILKWFGVLVSYSEKPPHLFPTDNACNCALLRSCDIPAVEIDFLLTSRVPTFFVILSALRIEERSFVVLDPDPNTREARVLGYTIDNGGQFES